MKTLSLQVNKIDTVPGYSQEGRVRDTSYLSPWNFEVLKLCLMDWGGLKGSRWQTKPTGPEGRLFLGTGSGSLSGSLDSAPGLGSERGEGFWAGVLADSIFSHNHLNAICHGERMSGLGARASGCCGDGEE